jgi:hypothetical protein
LSPPEIIAERTSLPVLVAKSTGSETGPGLDIGPRVGAAENGVVAERTRVDVTLVDEEAIFRVQFALRDWRNEVGFAMPGSAKSLEMFVQGKRLTAPPVTRTNGDGRIVYILQPSGSAGVGTVEFRYRGPADALEPPVLVGGTSIGGATWFISGRHGFVVLIPGRTSGSWSPEAFLSTLSIGARVPGFSGEPVTVLQQSELGAVAIYQIPKYTWLLGCSMGAVAIALVLACLGRRPRSLVVLIGALVLAVAVFLIPQPASRAVFAAIPGLLAVAFLALIFRWARMRHRRRVSRAFGFARPGSSLIRPSAARLRESVAGDAAVKPATAPTTT